jgi:hypothetical protein
MNSVLLTCNGEIDRGGAHDEKAVGCSETAVRAASHGDPMREMALTAKVRAEYPPPGTESMQGASARQINGGSLLEGGGSVGAKFAQGRSYL